MTFRDGLEAHRVIAILRAPDGTHLDAVIDALVESGIRLLEVTVPTPGGLAALRRAVRAHGKGVLIGAGTVLTPDDVAAAHDAGASFVVSPHVDPVVIEAAESMGIAALPGAMTPTEALLARRAGATAVKVFPARALGPGWVADVLAPLPGLPLIPVGGVGSEDVPRYLDAGAVGVGVGGPLLGDALLTGSLDGLKARARAFAEAGAA